MFIIEIPQNVLEEEIVMLIKHKCKLIANT